MLILAASCGAAPDHPFMDDIPLIIPSIPAGETFIFQNNEYSIIVNTESMLPYHFFNYMEGLFQVCYDAGNHFDHGHGCLNVGFTDTYGNVIIPLEYRLGWHDELHSDGLVLLVSHDFRYGYADASGEFVIPVQFMHVSGFNEDGLLIAGKIFDDGSHGYGIINREGETVLPFEYEFLTNLSGDAVVVAEFGSFTTRYGLMDIRGEIIIPVQYEFMHIDINEGLVHVQTGGHPAFDYPDRKHGVYDIAGNVVIPAELDYAFVSNFFDGLASVTQMTGDHVVISAERGFTQPVLIYGYIDKTGALAIPMDFNLANHFADGLALVGVYEDISKGDAMLYGFIDTRGNAAVPVIYADAREFSEGLAAVGIKTAAGIKYGYVNRRGETVIPFEFDAAELFGGGFAWVRINGMWGMIDSAGNAVIPPIYQSYSKVSDGLAAVKSRNLWELTDFSGNVAVQYSFESLHIFSHGLAIVRKDGKFGLINTSGEIVVPLVYDEIQRFDDFIIVRENGLRGIWRIVPSEE